MSVTQYFQFNWQIPINMCGLSNRWWTLIQCFGNILYRLAFGIFGSFRFREQKHSIFHSNRIIWNAVSENDCFFCSSIHFNQVFVRASGEQSRSERCVLGYYCIWDIRIFHSQLFHPDVCVSRCESEQNLSTALSPFFPSLPNEKKNNTRELGTAVECLSIYVNWPHKLIFFPLLKSTLLNEYRLKQ